MTKYDTRKVMVATASVPYFLVGLVLLRNGMDTSSGLPFPFRVALVTFAAVTIALSATAVVMLAKNSLMSWRASIAYSAIAVSFSCAFAGIFA